VTAFDHQAVTAFDPVVPHGSWKADKSPRRTTGSNADTRRLSDFSRQREKLARRT
jgi:hypothetical protein